MSHLGKIASALLYFTAETHNFVKCVEVKCQGEGKRVVRLSEAYVKQQ
jgi:hypothetical protein